MKSVSRLALGVALVLGGASVVATASASAQKNAQPAAQPQQRAYKFSKEERAALAPVQTAITAKDWAAATAALPAAQAAAKSGDARYAVARFQLEIGVATQNVQMQAQAIDGLIASGAVTGSDLGVLYRNQGALARQAGDRAKAEAAFTRYAELSPNDPEALINLAQLKNDARKPQEAVQLMDRAIAARFAAGQKADESWYKYALKLAFDNKMKAQATKISRDLVAAYPTKENWRDALLIFRDVNSLDGETQTDLLRLMRASDALAGERDWYDLADNLYKAGAYAEAKAVLDEGMSKRMIDPKKAAFAELVRLTNTRLAGDRASLPAEETKAMAGANGALAVKIADAWMGYKEYGKAIALYRAALTKGGVDSGLVNTRLGIALLASGNRAEAEAAFRAVTGPRAELAAFWLAHLSRRA